MAYLTWKLLHVAAVVIFLGNIATGAFWAARAHKTRDLQFIASTFTTIIRSDRWFTIPGVVGIIVGGVGTALSGHLSILGTGWILWSIVLFAMSGMVFGLLAPLQRRIVQLTSKEDQASSAWERYEATYKQWSLWGALALIAPVAAFVIMVMKPSLPAF